MKLILTVIILFFVGLLIVGLIALADFISEAQKEKTAQKQKAEREKQATVRRRARQTELEKQKPLYIKHLHAIYDRLNYEQLRQVRIDLATIYDCRFFPSEDGWYTGMTQERFRAQDHLHSILPNAKWYSYNVRNNCINFNELEETPSLEFVLWDLQYIDQLLSAKSRPPK